MIVVWLGPMLERYDHAFQVLQYITLRSVMSAITALCVSLLCGPAVIRWLQHYKVGQVVRTEGPKSHLSKSGTPTMGGVLIMVAVLVSMIIWADWHVHAVWVALLVTMGYALVGALDDYRKLTQKNTKGLSARGKLVCQTGIAFLAAVYLFSHAQVPAQTQLFVPFLKHVHFSLGWWFVPLTVLVVVGTSNAVNLTDGLDGLAILPAVLVAGALGVFAYVTGHAEFSRYLAIPYVPGASELAVFCAALVGAGLGFLWFNSYPAQVFMGDVGSLGLGAALGTVACLVRQELLLVVMGGVFVMEAMSVILQVASFKLRGKRIFKMAPIHHHFELKGWPEPKVIVRFWIITFILVLFSLATLKIR